MTDWRKIYNAARMQVHDSAITKTFIAGAGGFVIFNIAMCMTVFGKVPLTITAFFLAVAIVLAFGYGLSAWRDYMGNPIVLVAEVLAKEHRQTTDNSNAEPVHQYYVKLDISEAFQLTEAGISDALPRYRGQKTLPTQERLYLNLQEHEVATLLCTPAGVPFAYLDDWMTEEYEKEA